MHAQGYRALQDKVNTVVGDAPISACRETQECLLCADAHEPGDDVCLWVSLLLPLPVQLRDPGAVLPRHPHPCQH